MKIWLAFEEPKSVIMLRPLYNRLIKEHDVFITARDFDSTYYLLEQWGVPYIKTGAYGGGTLIGKLKAYAKHLMELINVVEKENPDFLFCITSPEAIRVAFGLQLPHVMFNDEPRSYGCCALTLPFVEKVVVPKAIPIEWYLDYGIKREKIVQFNGIDEVAWLNRDVFKPSKEPLKELSLDEGKYIICRTEPTKAVYLIDKMKPFETQLTKIIPRTLEISKDEYVYIIITRNEEQYNYLNKFFKKEIDTGIIRIYRGLANLQDLMYYSKMVWSGCGTMIRESALLGVPSISFWPMDTYPQELFLMQNGFPLKHVQELDEIIKTFRYFLEEYKRKDTFAEIDKLEDPVDIGYRLFRERIEQINKNK
ncbi:MAG: DUF354 domain-containing protein [Promethearchaeota archaeon]